MDGLLDMAGKSYELIDMEQQMRRPPRIGAQDTIPFFPLLDITLDECVNSPKSLGTRLYERYGVPGVFQRRERAVP